MSQHAAPVYGKCPVCGGQGWEIFELPEMVLGVEEKLEYARKCTKCGTIHGRDNNLTRIPPEFHDADLSKFNFGAYSINLANIERICRSFVSSYSTVWAPKGKGLYLWSKIPGTGKTFLACCLANSITVKTGVQMRFVSAPDYLATVRESLKRERGEIDPSEIFRTCDLLVLDDIGAQAADREWQRSEIFRLVDERMKAGGITIFTSNTPPDHLSLEERTKDRIIKMSIVLEMPNESIRRKKAVAEQERFLQNILR